MRSVASALLFAAVVGFAASSAHAAGGFVQSLPKDGEWVKFSVESDSRAGLAAGGSGTMTLRSVGTVQEKGETCRWLEMDFDGDTNGTKVRAVMKFLVREKDFKPDAKEPPKVLRGWKMGRAGDNKDDVTELSNEEMSPGGPASMFLSTKLKDAKTVKEAKTIDYQKGRLKVESAELGELEMDAPQYVPQGFSSKFRQTIWKHKAVPFGTAAAAIDIKVKQNDNVLQDMTMKFEVLDHGKDAKSAFPDKK